MTHEKQEELCQTIINKETGEICGHERSMHIRSEGECWEHLKDGSICTCKKFKPQNHSSSVRSHTPSEVHVKTSDTRPLDEEGNHSQDASTRKDEESISKGNSSSIIIHPDTKEFDLSEKRKELLKLLEAYLNGEQADIILKKVKEQDKEFIKIVEKDIDSLQHVRVYCKNRVKEILQKRAGKNLSGDEK